jgi:ribonuclease HII
MPPDLVRESSFWQVGHLRIAGVDEVGRGCLSGPVVAAAVILPVHCQEIPGIDDSKKIAFTERERLCAVIHQQAIAIGVGAASVAEIDRVNILQATYLAMGRALARIQPVDHALIDGSALKRWNPGPHTTVIDGDAHCYSIACASIVAKVVRDRFMMRLAERFPGYMWETNFGYGTKAHLLGLEQLGVTPWHRRTFAPVRAYLVEQLSISGCL